MFPFQIQRLDHVVLRVKDLQRSLDFYVGVLGSQVKKRRDDLGMIHLSAGASMIDLVDIHGSLGQQRGVPDPEHSNVDHFCLRIEPFNEAAIVAHMLSSGIAVSPGVTRFGAEGNGPSIYCYDPDGKQVELKGPSA